MSKSTVRNPSEVYKIVGSIRDFVPLVPQKILLVVLNYI